MSDKLKVSERISDQGKWHLTHNWQVCGLSLHDTELNILWMNKVLLEWLGYDLDDVVGKNVTDLQNPENKVHWQNVVLPQLLQSGFCHLWRRSAISKKGEEVWMDVQAIAVDDHAGSKKQGFLFGFVNRTKEVETERELILAKQVIATQKQQFDQAKGNLTPTESRVEAHVKKGLTSKQIAQEMGVSPRTVDTHRHNIRNKK